MMDRLNGSEGADQFFYIIEALNIPNAHCIRKVLCCGTTDLFICILR